MSQVDEGAGVATGHLEVGLSFDSREVIVNHPDLPINQNGRGGYLAFTPDQARSLATLLNKKADDADGREAAASGQDALCKAAVELYVKARFEPVNEDPLTEAWVISPLVFAPFARAIQQYRNEEK